MMVKRMPVVLSLAAALVIVASVPASGEPLVYINPGFQDVEQFDFCAANVVVNDEVLGVTGFDLLIDYDESVLTLDNVFEGPLPGSGGAATFFFWTHVGSPPEAVLIQGAVLGDSVDGPGTLCALVFQGAALGVSPVSFEVANCELRDLDNNQIPVSYTDGAIEVVEPPVPVENVTWGGIKALYD